MFKRILTSVSLCSSASSKHLKCQCNVCNLVSSVFLMLVLVNKLAWTTYLCNLPVCSPSSGSSFIHHSQYLSSVSTVSFCQKKKSIITVSDYSGLFLGFIKTQTNNNSPFLFCRESYLLSGSTICASVSPQFHHLQ